MLNQRRNNLANLLDRLPGPVNNFRETTSSPAIEIERDRVLGAELLLKITRRNLAGHKLPGEGDQLRVVHALSLVGRTPTRQMPIASSTHDEGYGTALSTRSPEAAAVWPKCDRQTT